MSADEHEADAGGMRLAPGVVVPTSRLRFTYASSRGPGGQNVNKRQTKAELRIMPDEIPLRPTAMSRFLVIAEPWITSEGEILIVADEHRSQARNREACLDRLSDLVRRALVVPKRRTKTKPTRSSVERRLTEKRVRSERKRRRGEVDEG